MKELKVHTDSAIVITDRKRIRTKSTSEIIVNRRLKLKVNFVLSEGNKTCIYASKEELARDDGDDRGRHC